MQVSISVVMVAMTVIDGELTVAVCKRGSAPLKGRLELPNLPLTAADRLAQTAADVATEELGCPAADLELEQLSAHGAAKRDPRGPAVSIAWWTVLDAPTDQEGLTYLPVADVPTARLAFDHASLVSEAVDRLARDLRYTTVATRLCDDLFTMAQLRRVYEVVWGVELDPANFHRKVTGSTGFVEPTSKVSQGGPGRPAQFYRRGEARDLVSPITRPTD